RRRRRAVGPRPPVPPTLPARPGGLVAIPETILDSSPDVAGFAVPDRRPPRPRRRGRGWEGLLLPLLVVVLWEVGARVGFVSTRLLPSPSQIAHTVASLAASGELVDHAVAALWRGLWGIRSGAAGGRVVGT